ncbi:hypothetical protein C8A01DRAFT_12486 [Parachaetomium inaequale]|uniref:Uncharacterized protein n=1 Tax=Parachaetomium inaequale TaxID=2588326 RepID=A0AAN6SVZ4_9PEZI|nr:hypothetical protein C8A01DRAFT_12486 [Parachaetomium inaequale]
MSSQETTPLLSDRPDLPLHVGPTRVHDAAPISARVCRSAWPWLGQRALVFVRGGILTYLTALLPLLVRNKVVGNTAGGQTPWGVMFDFSTIAHVLQWLWHLVSFVMIFNLSPPDEPESSSKHFYPSLLYTAAHVFNFINTAMYWAVLVPQGHGNFPNGGAPGTGWLQPLSVANMYGVTSLIASSEVMFLNTIKHQHAVSNHVLSTMFLLAGYLGWAAIGNTMTGHYPIFWMDPKEMGSAGLVAAYAAGFVAMGPAMFAALYGLTSLREKLAKYASRSEGYSRIHDSDDEHAQSQRTGDQRGSRA